MTHKVDIHVKATRKDGDAVYSAYRATEERSKALNEEAGRARDLLRSSWVSQAAEKPFVAAYTPYTAGPTNIESIQKNFK
jgi:hypothetical protein